MLLNINAMKSVRNYISDKRKYDLLHLEIHADEKDVGVKEEDDEIRQGLLARAFLNSPGLF